MSVVFKIRDEVLHPILRCSVTKESLWFERTAYVTWKDMQHSIIVDFGRIYTSSCNQILLYCVFLSNLTESKETGSFLLFGCLSTTAALSIGSKWTNNSRFFIHIRPNKLQCLFYYDRQVPYAAFSANWFKRIYKTLKWGSVCITVLYSNFSAAKAWELHQQVLLKIE